MAFTWQVIIDGSDISELVEDGATITYGRRSLLEQPSTPTAVLRLLTRDAWPGAAGSYPEFGLGDWATDLSGFTDDYADCLCRGDSPESLSACLWSIDGQYPVRLH